MKIKEVNKNWFIGKLPGAAFFGQSVGEVSMKANDWRELFACSTGVFSMSEQREVFLFKSLRSDYEAIFATDVSEYLEDQYVLLGSGMATIEMLDPIVVTQNQITVLRKSKQTIQAKHQLELELIDDRIQSLSAIGHES